MDGPTTPKSFYDTTGNEASKLLSERVTGRDHHHIKTMDANRKAAEASEYILKVFLF